MRHFKGGVWLLASLALLASACGGQGGGSTPDAGTGGVDSGGGGGGAARRLAFVGPALVTVATDAKVDLQVALVQENVGAVVGEPVTFEIIDNAGSAAGSSFGGSLTATATTDDGGVAKITLSSGSTETTFQVLVSAQGANDIGFGVQVVKLRQVLQIVRTPSVRLEASGIQARVDSAAFTQVFLKVRVTDQYGNALENVGVTYTFDSPAKSATLDTTQPVTGAAGEAQVTLDTGTDLTDTFAITARTSESVTVKWLVNLQAGDLRTCKDNSECPPAQTCNANGICEGVPGCKPGEVECPPGYQCSANGECSPVFGTGCTTDDQCGAGNRCDQGQCVAIDPGCDANNPCPDPSFVCQAGTCVPGGSPPADISGPWYTAHTFHIGDAIPFANDIAGPIRTIDRLFLGDLGLPGWLQSVVDGLIADYIPSWVPDLIHVLDVIVTILQDLRARGYMTVAQTGGAWTATELWESFVFYDLTLCGSHPGSNPTPKCARVDLFVNDPGVPADLGLKVYPFNGTVSSSSVIVNRRKVEMRVAKLVGWLVDKLVDLFTPYHTLADALVAVIDCAAVGNFVDSATGGWVSASTAESICHGAVQKGAQAVTNALYNLAFDLGLLNFEGSASITQLSGNRAEELGTTDFEQSNDGSYTGDFMTSALHSITGSWRASRRQIP